MWACFKQFGPELHDRKTAPISLEVRMLKAEVIEILLYGFVTWTLGADHFGKLRTVHHRVLLRVIDFQRRQRADNTTLSFAKALKNTRCESIETTIHIYGRRGAAKQGAITQSGDVRDDDRWGGPETGRTAKDLA